MAIGRLGTGFGRMGASGAAGSAAGLANAETTIWVNAVVGDGGSVSAGRQTLVDNLITSLKSASVWTKLDRLLLLAAENSQSALRDIVAASQASVAGTPTFTANQGYTGTDGATTANYVLTNFNPSTAGGNYTQNAAHLGIWINADFTTVNGGVATGLQTAAVTQSNILPRYTDGKAYYRINDQNAASAGVTTASAAGHYVANRSGAAAQQGYKNAVDQSVVAVSSAALTNESFEVLGQRTTTPTNILGFGGQASVWHAGGNLSAQNVTDLNSALATYRTAVGL